MSIGKNAAVGMATNVAIFGLGILLSIVLTRSLGAEQRGVYTLLVTTNTLLANIGSLSVGAACSNLLAKQRYTLGQVNTVALLLALALGMLSAAIVSLAFPLLHESVFPQVPFGFMLMALLLVDRLTDNYYSSAIAT